jgi:transposase
MPLPALHFLGCDRSDYHLDLTLLAPDAPRHTSRISAQPAAVLGWIREWRRRHPQDQLAIGFEQPASNLIALFAPFDFVLLYPLNPATLARYRRAFVPSGAKDDPGDSFWLADLVRTHRDKLTVWQPQSVTLRKLQALVETRRGAVDMLTALSHKLTSLLKTYFPEALDLIGDDHASPLAVAFLRRWPTLAHLQRSRWSAIETFYRQHGAGRASALERRRELIAQAEPLTADGAVLEPAQLHLELLLDQIEPLRTAIARFEQRIAETFASHPDHAIVASLPGAAQVYAPRLLAALGEQRERLPDARALQCFSGIAPIVIRSGRSCWVKRRHACPKFVRQSFHEWAGESIRHSRWARAYYQQQKDQGKPHHTVARALAFKWQRIIARCWHDRVPYNEDTYMKALSRSHPELYQLALQTSLPKDAKN